MEADEWNENQLGHRYAGEGKGNRSTCVRYQGELREKQGALKKSLGYVYKKKAERTGDLKVDERCGRVPQGSVLCEGEKKGKGGVVWHPVAKENEKCKST